MYYQCLLVATHRDVKAFSHCESLFPTTNPLRNSMSVCCLTRSGIHGCRGALVGAKHSWYSDAILCARQQIWRREERLNVSTVDCLTELNPVVRPEFSYHYISLLFSISFLNYNCTKHQTAISETDEYIIWVGLTSTLICLSLCYSAIRREVTESSGRWPA